MERRKPISENIQHRITKFFISNLPDRCGGKEARSQGGGHRQSEHATYGINRDEGYTGSNGSRSFRDILMGRKSAYEDQKIVIVDNNLQAFVGLHGGALVANMIDMEALKNINLILKEISPADGMVQYLGGVTVLLSFLDNKSAMSAMEKTRDIVGRFSKIELWEGQVLNVDRIAWLRIFGMPLQLLRNEVLDSVGRLFGTIVQNANVLEEEGDLSSEFIGVLIGNGRRVSEEVSIQWQGKRFQVWVREEEGAWVPEFLSGDVRSVNSLVSNEEDIDIVEEGVDEMKDREDLYNQEEYLPGPNFLFENPINVEEDGLNGTCNITKRKKINKWEDLGRPSCYSSSGSGHCKGKKARCKDPFGLNDILGLEEEDRNIVMVQFNEEAADYNSPGGIDLHMDPSKWVETQQPDGGSEEEPMGSLPGSSNTIISEIEATKILGESMGAMLANFDQMIGDSIVQERSQLGKS
ncbi:hypothetical protein L1987_08256 [Smallanthus sonchifolius]|uniref:Uncharacterized protein n=1 Tax=Smallanthus sonchifolius TaxID=185202 RepID=A0ACB9JLA4_9ASTR|nr:hypothetical protein L1987_08256 [Smallanthus sonchifolius]